MRTPRPYKGILYSIADLGNGKWRWKLHPKLVPNQVSTIVSGEADSHDDAITEAEAAIDKLPSARSN